MAIKPAVSTNELQNLLSTKYAYPEHILLFEVRNDAGFNANRSIDALAMSLWPSRGLELIGFELKATRSDWMREKKNPAKADDVVKYCDRWFLVIGDPSIALLDEVPASWGLMVPKGRGLSTVKEAPKLEPTSVDRGFMACMFKRACDGMIHKSSIEDRINDARKTAQDLAAQSHSREEKQMQRENQSLKRRLQEMQDAFNLSSYALPSEIIKRAEDFRKYLALSEHDAALKNYLQRVRDQVQKVSTLVNDPSFMVSESAG